MPASKFRFEDLEIWKLAIEISDRLFNIVDTLENKKLYKFSEQLRGSAMSMSNNIAEGSGSDSNKEFANFLNTKLSLRGGRRPTKQSLIKHGIRATRLSLQDVN